MQSLNREKQTRHVVQHHSPSRQKHDNAQRPHVLVYQPTTLYLHPNLEIVDLSCKWNIAQFPNYITGGTRAFVFPKAHARGGFLHIMAKYYRYDRNNKGRVPHHEPFRLENEVDPFVCTTSQTQSQHQEVPDVSPSTWNSALTCKIEAAMSGWMMLTCLLFFHATRSRHST